MKAQIIGIILLVLSATSNAQVSALAGIGLMKCSMYKQLLKDQGESQSAARLFDGVMNWSQGFWSGKNLSVEQLKMKDMPTREFFKGYLDDFCKTKEEADSSIWLGLNVLYLERK